MKLEKISDNQFRCTLTSADLADRKIRLSELAYGTEKAKALFHDMMQQAHTEFGFDTDNAPLMIEAVPMFPDSIILIITKVDDPEELDTRFSRFTPAVEDAVRESAEHFTGADDILDLFHKLCEARNQAEAPENDAATEEGSAAETINAENSGILQSFLFDDLDDVIAAAHSLSQVYDGENSLYKDDTDGSFLLILHPAETTPEHFNKVCNILSEYGSIGNFSPAAEASMKEHRKPFLAERALQRLAAL